MLDAIPLDPVQAAAVRSASDRVIIRGDSGSGKSHTLQARYCRRARAGAINPAATVVIAEGSESRPGADGGWRPVGPTALAARLLRQSGPDFTQPDFTLLDDRTAAGLLAWQLALPAGKGRQEDARRPAFVREARYLLNSAGGPLSTRQREALDGYVREKTRQNLLDRRDVIYWALRRLRSARWPDRSLRHLFIDDLCRWSADEQNLLRELVAFARTATITVGVARDGGIVEPGFGGAGVAEFTLAFNHRSGGAIGQAVARLSGRRLRDLRPAGQGPRSIVAGTLAGAARAAAESIAACLNERTAASDLAVLCREWTMGRHLATQLARNGITHVLIDPRREPPADWERLRRALEFCVNPRLEWRDERERLLRQRLRRSHRRGTHTLSRVIGGTVAEPMSAAARGLLEQVTELERRCPRLSLRELAARLADRAAVRGPWLTEADTAGRVAVHVGVGGGGLRGEYRTVMLLDAIAAEEPSKAAGAEAFVAAAEKARDELIGVTWERDERGRPMQAPWWLEALRASASGIGYGGKPGKAV